MRRAVILILCAALLTGVVYADNRTDEIRTAATVLPDGSAQVTLTVNMKLEEAPVDLTFPLPKGAEDVILNGNPVDTSASRVNSSVDLVKLNHLNGMTGSHSLTFAYTLPAVVDYQEDPKHPDGRYLLLRLPLLSGFEYPVENMSFTVQLPEGVEGSPSFYSGYFLQSIESNLTYTYENGTISGAVTTKLKDKETLRLEMTVNQEQFPELVIIENEDLIHLFAMLAAAGLALLFWLLVMPSLPVYPRRRSLPPVGIHAGELGSRLTMEGGDLTMLVFHWAQLGYIHIVPDKRGHIWLHKRMDMGNERSDFEIKYFNLLFGRNRSVDGTGSRYGRLWNTVRQTLDQEELITRGGRKARGFFRFLAMLVSGVAGAAMGLKLAMGTPWLAAAIAGFALLGCFTAWKIQAGTMKMHLRHRESVPVCMMCCVLWMGVGLLTDHLLAAALSTGFQLLAGLMTAWSGRRTKAGWQMACKILGLRHYLKGIKREELKEQLDRDPDYFFTMAPYAMAMGVDNAFAGRFGGRVLLPCSYLEADRSLRRTARGWIYLMQITAKKLDDAGRRAQKYRKR